MTPEEATTLLKLLITDEEMAALALLEAGADVNIRSEPNTRYGHACHLTPLHFAAKVNRPKLLERLLEKGADIEARNSLKETALHTAALHGSLEAAKCLVARGAEVTARRNSSILPKELVGASGQRHHKRRALYDFLCWAEETADSSIRDSQCRLRRVASDRDSSHGNER